MSNDNSVPEYPQIPPPQQVDVNAMMAPYMSMMVGMQSQMANMAASQANQMPIMPEPTQSLFENVDWAEKQSKLSEKMRADYALDNARRVSRADTVLTSPLLDDDEADITSPLIQE